MLSFKYNDLGFPRFVHAYICDMTYFKIVRLPLSKIRLQLLDTKLGSRLKKIKWNN